MHECIAVAAGHHLHMHDEGGARGHEGQGEEEVRDRR